MARKNRRRETYAPLDLTPIELDVAPFTEEQKQRRRERHAESDALRARRQAEARINKGIDWSVCVVPGCGRSMHGYDGAAHHDLDKRDAELAIPICIRHASVIWQQMARFARTPEMIEAVADVQRGVAERDARLHEERKASRLANVAHGDIYFVRVGNLIKVGWTRDLWSRLKAYGASAELLVSYPGSRDDETNLHRQLSPARAKGREWYTDGPIVAKFIADALSQYGQPPPMDGLWSEPKKVVAGKRAMRYR